MSSFDPEPFLLSFRLAAATTVILFAVSVPLAWVLSMSRSRFKPFECLALHEINTLSIIFNYLNAPL